MTPSARVLVCDDDPLLLDLLTFRLEAKGFSVTAANDGGQAMKALATDTPSAIVLDAMMPVMDGYEVLRRIRETPEWQSIPVIMLTARKQERDVVGALELGASDFIAKPFIPEELVARLTRLIERSAA